MIEKTTDKLTIDFEEKVLEIDILSVIHSRNCCYSNLEEAKTFNGYNLAIDTESLKNETLKDLEEITNTLDNLYKVRLKLSGKIKQGVARIAYNMGLYGLTLQLEMQEIQPS